MSATTIGTVKSRCSPLTVATKVPKKSRDMGNEASNKVNQLKILLSSENNDISNFTKSIIIDKLIPHLEPDGKKHPILIYAKLLSHAIYSCKNESVLDEEIKEVKMLVQKIFPDLKDSSKVKEQALEENQFIENLKKTFQPELDSEAFEKNKKLMKEISGCFDSNILASNDYNVELVKSGAVLNAPGSQQSKEEDAKAQLKKYPELFNPGCEVLDRYDTYISDNRKLQDVISQAVDSASKWNNRCIEHFIGKYDSAFRTHLEKAHIGLDGKRKMTSGALVIEPITRTKCTPSPEENQKAKDELEVSLNTILKIFRDNLRFHEMRIEPFREEAQLHFEKVSGAVLMGTPLTNDKYEVQKKSTDELLTDYEKLRAAANINFKSLMLFNIQLDHLKSKLIEELKENEQEINQKKSEFLQTNVMLHSRCVDLDKKIFNQQLVTRLYKTLNVLPRKKLEA